MNTSEKLFLKQDYVNTIRSSTLIEYIHENELNTNFAMCIQFDLVDPKVSVFLWNRATLEMMPAPINPKLLAPIFAQSVELGWFTDFETNVSDTSKNLDSLYIKELQDGLFI